MGDPSDDDVPTMTSAADLRRDDDESGADADDRTLQKPPDAVTAAEQEDARKGAPVPAAGLPPVPADKLPPPPATPLRPRLPSSPSATPTGPAPSKKLSPAPPGVLARAPTPSPAAAAAAAAAALGTKPRAPSSPGIRPRAPSAPATMLDADDPPSESPTSPKSPAVTAPKLPPRPASKSSPAPIEADEPSDDSITATAPRVPAPNIPLSVPQVVEIRTLEDDADETEVKTLAADVNTLVQSARAEARANGAGATADRPPRAPSSPVIRISPSSLMPPTDAAPSTDRDDTIAYDADADADDEESITARGPAVGAEYPDDSVTTQAPKVPGLGHPPAIDGETEGTTKKVRKDKALSGKDGDEDDEESITAQAPGHLTNMLRVIASPSPSEADDDSIQAHTQVMLNAPVKPSELSSRSGGAAVARQLEPSSESGLRVANGAEATGLPGERASLGALGVPGHDPHRASMRSPIASDAALGPSPSDGLSHAPFGAMPPLEEPEKKPPYALVVGIVAIVSIAIPVLLFVILSQGTSEVVPRVAAQPTPDPVGITGPRPRAARATPSATSTATPRRGPFRR